MKKFLLLLCLLLAFTVGCGSDLSGDTYTICIPNKDDTYLEVQWPVECVIKYTDNATYWEFVDGSLLYTSDSPELIYNEDADTYTVGDKPDERKIIYTGNVISEDLFKSTVNNATVVNNRLNLPAEKEWYSVPEYQTREISLDDRGMAMPSEFISLIKDTANYYSASLLLVNKDDYLTAFILDRNLEDAKQELYNMVCAGSELDSWYYNKDNGYLIFKSCNKYAVAKAIRTNEWYVYLGTEKYIDYMLSGAKLVTYSD